MNYVYQHKSTEDSIYCSNNWYFFISPIHKRQMQMSQRLRGTKAIRPNVTLVKSPLSKIPCLDSGLLKDTACKKLSPGGEKKTFPV